MSGSPPGAEFQIPLRELRFSFARSSGPGGQNVNKVNSKALLRWSVLHSPTLSEQLRQRLLSQFGHRITNDGELILSSERFRDAGRNVADCLEKLRTILREASQPPQTRKATRPTRASRRRRVENKRQRSQAKRARRFPIEDH